MDTKKPPLQLNEGELKHLPKYLCYKASLLREKMFLGYLLAGLSTLFVVYFMFSRYEIHNLYLQLRTKEYILAPGVQDFTVVTPQSVPDSYVHDAANDFLTSLGNINASNIEDSYSSLQRFMSDEFKIQFANSTRNWINQVQGEDLSQIFKVRSKKITTTDRGTYHVTAHAQVSFYAANQFIGKEKQVVEMTLELIPPERSKRWYLQITDLSWSKLADFNLKSKFKKESP